MLLPLPPPLPRLRPIVSALVALTIVAVVWRAT
jgi:hypothetical protein